MTDPSGGPFGATRRSSMLAVVALAATCFGMSLNANVLAALNPYLGSALGFDKGQLGALSGAAGLAGTAGALLLGGWVDRVGRRPPLLIGTALFFVASLGYLAASSFALLLVVRIATGFVAGVVLTSASSAVADLIPYERRGLAMGLVTAGIMLAIPVGMPLAVLLADAGLWRAVFVLQIAAAALTFVALHRVLPEGLGRGGRKVSPLEVVRARGVAPALVSVVLYNGAFFATMQFLGTWLDESRVLGRSSQVWMWVALGAVSALGGATLGAVADKLGKRATVLWTTAIVAVGFLLLARVGSVAALIAIGVPVGVVSAVRSAALLALVSDLVRPDARGTLMGIRTAAVNLGIGAFPLLAGVVYEHAGFPRFVQLAAAAMIAAYLVVRIGVPEPAASRAVPPAVDSEGARG